MPEDKIRFLFATLPLCKNPKVPYDVRKVYLRTLVVKRLFFLVLSNVSNKRKNKIRQQTFYVFSYLLNKVFGLKKYIKQFHRYFLENAESKLFFSIEMIQQLKQSNKLRNHVNFFSNLKLFIYNLIGGRTIFRPMCKEHIIAFYGLFALIKIV